MIKISTIRIIIRMITQSNICLNFNLKFNDYSIKVIT